MKRTIEKLIDQASIEEALSKMRNGVCLLLEDGVFNYIYELRNIDNLNGEKEEKIFAFDSKDHKFKDVYDLEWWGELHAEYVNAPHCTMSSDEALEILKSGRPVMSPRYIYFTGTINSNGFPEVDGIEYVFAIPDYRSSRHIYLRDALDKFTLPDDSDYGYVM